MLLGLGERVQVSGLLGNCYSRTANARSVTTQMRSVGSLCSSFRSGRHGTRRTIKSAAAAWRNRRNRRMHGKGRETGALDDRLSTSNGTGMSADEPGEPRLDLTNLIISATINGGKAAKLFSSAF
jgi:hypothetical protein